MLSWALGRFPTPISDLCNGRIAELRPTSSAFCSASRAATPRRRADCCYRRRGAAQAPALSTAHRSSWLLPRPPPGAALVPVTHWDTRDWRIAPPARTARRVQDRRAPKPRRVRRWGTALTSWLARGEPRSGDPALRRPAPIAAFMSERIASSEREATIGTVSPATWTYVRRPGPRPSSIGSTATMSSARTNRP